MNLKISFFKLFLAYIVSINYIEIDVFNLYVTFSLKLDNLSFSSEDYFPLFATANVKRPKRKTKYDDLS